MNTQPNPVPDAITGALHLSSEAAQPIVRAAVHELATVLRETAAQLGAEIERNSRRAPETPPAPRPPIVDERAQAEDSDCAANLAAWISYAFALEHAVMGIDAVVKPWESDARLALLLREQAQLIEYPHFGQVMEADLPDGAFGEVDRLELWRWITGRICGLPERRWVDAHGREIRTEEPTKILDGINRAMKKRLTGDQP